MQLTIRARLTILYFVVLAASFFAFFWICDFGFQSSIETTVNEASRGNLQSVRKVVENSLPKGVPRAQHEQYAVVDLDGHHWLFSRHARDVSPDEWGARIAQPAFRLALLRRPRVCYLEIPAVDIRQSVAFYESVFGWNIRHRDTDRPSFDDATGNVSGAWVTGREIAREPGLLTYIWVDHIDATLAEVKARGGVVVATPVRDSPGDAPWIASSRDPAGNLFGLYQEGPRDGVS